MLKKTLGRAVCLLSPLEWGLYLCSVTGILLSFFLCGGREYLYLTASLLGATALIFVSKGNPAGQLLTVIFSGFYGYVSYTFRYYGEMITYLGMSAPIALAAFIAWLRHPYRGNRAEVAVNRPRGREYLLIALTGAAVTAAFYFILRALNTANLWVSTLSVFTSWAAVCLTLRRSPFYALGYAANDVVLIVLWTLAALQDGSYWSMTVCFIVFFLNDLYGFFNWMRMQRRQTRPALPPQEARETPPDAAEGEREPLR